MSKKDIPKEAELQPFGGKFSKFSSFYRYFHEKIEIFKIGDYNGAQL